MGLFDRAVRRKAEEALTRKAELDAIKAEMLQDVQVEREKIFQDAQNKLMQDPLFASAWRQKQELEKAQYELNKVLDYGLTERVIRRLVQESEERQVTVTIRFPRVLGDDGIARGGEEIFIQPINKYEQMKKAFEPEQLW